MQADDPKKTEIRKHGDRGKKFNNKTPLTHNGTMSTIIKKTNLLGLVLK
jgi:hypothetical protein